MGKILWLTENYPPRRGGMAQACDRIVGNLRQSGLEIDLVFFGPCKSSRVLQQQQGRMFMVAEGESPGHVLNCFWNQLTADKNACSYSHVVAFGGYLPILALPVLAGWTGAKAITMLRGNDFDLGIFSPSRRHLLLDAFSASTAICVLTKEQQNRLSAFVSAEKIALVHNGIDTDEWSPDSSELAAAGKWREENVSADRLVIGLIGQMKAKKGGDFFLKNALMAKIADRLHFLMVGDMDEQLQKRLAEKEEQLNFSCLPFADRWELLSIYPACDYVAIPSFYDGMPNVLLEAGALGVPVVASTAGGMVDVLEDGFSGFLFHPGDKHGCRNALWRVCNTEPSARKLMGDNLQKRIRNDFHSRLETAAYRKIMQ